ncbi:hypothetical protein HRM2_04180 [Desulforapulum autotrophicum HRM2]|uniref:Uncharacterized protein n=1 Tax=Desulforapulum autotrophicum (strain ATCC 43914 / DSM 3382 / VKM B-1955 / HRM2) TaxID=177437 RepID=C0QGR1_DESAH|nr:hypothetical protein [Desulforapulum autotrophicum]ACN13536.1 hypothetical protein HRM2_04180 [Desulforapulum autotrophicum HRM2]
MSFKSAISVLFLTGVAIGLYFAIDGLLQGPSYFANRLITIERMHKKESLVENKWGERRIKREWVMAYSFQGVKNQRQYGTRMLFDNELPKKPEYYRSGDTLVHRIPVPESQGGGFGLNLNVRNGLGISGYSLILGGPILVLIHLGHLPVVRKRKTLIALIPVIIFGGGILFQILGAFLS